MSSDPITEWMMTRLFHEVPVNISVINRNFEIVEANKRLGETYGPWRESKCYEVYKDRSEPCEDCGAVKTFADGQFRTREERGVTQEGRPIYYLVYYSPVVGPDGDIPYIVEMSTDITETKQLQRDKLDAERLAAVGQTVAGLAHGVKNIIMGLEGGMYVVNSGIKRNDAERLLRGWEILEEDIKRISAFMKEFLDFAKGRTPKVCVVDPNDVAGKVIGLFRDKASLVGVTLKQDFAEDLPKAPLDEEGIHICLTNLVSNAIDACEMSNKPNRSVTLSTGEEDGTLVFEVADDGCGMDYEVKQKVFTNFFSTKGSGKGTGLGLLTTRKIVQEHGGKVRFDSTEGEGSVFRMEFPRNRLPRPTESGST